MVEFKGARVLQVSPFERISSPLCNFVIHMVPKELFSVIDVDFFKEDGVLH